MASPNAGEFAGAKLLLDTSLDNGQTNSGLKTLSFVSTGDMVNFELFIDRGVGIRTFGFNLQFDDTGQKFSSSFTIEGIDGPLSTLGSPTATVLSVGSLSGVAVPSNGYLGTVTLKAKKNIENGTQIAFTSGSDFTRISDMSFNQDPLETTDALLTFQDTFILAIPGDADRDGDVDFADFVLLARNYGRSGPQPSPEGSGGEGSVAIQYVAVHDTITTPATVNQLVLSQKLTLTTTSSQWDTLLTRRLPVQVSGNEATASDEVSLDIQNYVNGLGNGGSTATNRYFNSVIGYSFTVPDGWETEEDLFDPSLVSVSRGLDAVIIVTAIQNTDRLVFSDLTDAFLVGMEAAMAQGGGISQYRRISVKNGLLGSLLSKEIVFTGNIFGTSIMGMIVIAIDPRYAYTALYLPTFQRDYNTYISGFTLVRSSFQGATGSAKLAVNINPENLETKIKRFGAKLKAVREK